MPPPFSLDDIKDVISNHLLGAEDILPQEFREENEILDELASTILAPDSPLKSTATGFALVSRARRVVTHLESLKQAISKALDERIEKAQTRVQRFGSLCGLASLPSTILADILWLASHGVFYSRPKEHSIAALRLSHVCRHFRNTALSMAKMWSEICAVAYPTPRQLGFVHACIERSKNAPLDVHLNVYLPEEEDNDSYFNEDAKFRSDEASFILLPHAHRWRSFNLHLVQYPASSNALEPPSMNLISSALESMRNLTYPMLESITLSFEEASIIVGKGMELCSSWNLPSLRSLSIVRSLPSTLARLDRVVTLDYTMFGKNMDDEDISSLVTLVGVLKRMSSLRDLALDLVSTTPAETPFPISDVVCLPSIQNLKITFGPHCMMEEDGESFNYPLLRSFFSVLRFQNTSNLLVLFQDGIKVSFVTPISDTRIVCKDLFGDNKIPNVKRCEIAIRLEYYHPTQLPPGEFQSILPTTFPQSVEHLKIECNTSLLSDPQSRSEEPCPLPNLRSVTRDSGQNSQSDTVARHTWLQWLTRGFQIGSRYLEDGLRVFEREMNGSRMGPKDGVLYYYDRMFCVFKFAQMESG
ncbi:hypothetical protein SCHPADRAFT_1002342 [Schizopora paradoxa]|uniref:F-box domain-containing protein n=1 Tax=Schizopora paradoxa TaxID=27342 RepID=A0A0H2RAE3_9AGAM|nr:hypothetical protein SCHPADRAFT_1002342 [Schizopora paradoxa]